MRGNLLSLKSNCFKIESLPDTSIEAGPVVSLDDVPAVDVAGTDGAVVRAL